VAVREQKVERAELALAVYRAAPLAELDAATHALNHADINLCAAWALYYDEMRDARQRETDRHGSLNNSPSNQTDDHANR
jgi:hypothetical protein